VLNVRYNFNDPSIRAGSLSGQKTEQSREYKKDDVHVFTWDAQSRMAFYLPVSDAQRRPNRL